MGKRYHHFLIPLVLLSVAGLSHLSSLRSNYVVYFLPREPFDEVSFQQQKLRRQVIKERLRASPKIDLQNNTKSTSNSVRKIAFLHIGKAGGNTVRSALPRLFCQRQQGKEKITRCWNKTARPDAPLREGAELEVHMNTVPLHGPKLLRENNYTSFLFALREPLSRIRSAYHYLHPNNTQSVYARMQNNNKDLFYKTCFPTWVDLLEAVDEAFAIARNAAVSSNYSIDDSTTNTMQPTFTDCQKLAIVGLRGEDPIVKGINVHFFYNHEYYANISMYQKPTTEVLVVRTESLWDDLIDLDRSLGGPGKFRHADAVLNENKNHTTFTDKKTGSPLSGNREANLCCVLWKEMAIYQDILYRAANLLPENKEATMRNLVELCKAGETYQYDQPMNWEQWQKASCPDLNPFLS